MSVIGRIEVANFLNLDNISPPEKGWIAHYPHCVLDCRGTNTIVQLANGGGKTTITNALLLLLTRDQGLSKKVRKFLAPKSRQLYSHVRLEVRHRDTFEQLSPGLFGDDVPGQPYVIGLYGFFDKSEQISYYVYQGELEDCPVAHSITKEIDGIEKIEIDLTRNQHFLETLRQQNNYKNRTKEEYLAEIHTHFDESFLSQQLQYHKLGAGDGNSNFFDVKPNRDECFSTAFFFEYIAPELLVDTMGDWAEDGETHFEDTLIISARKIIGIKTEQEKLNKKYEGLQNTYLWLNTINTDVIRYQQKHEELKNEVGALLLELQFMTRCIIDQPLPYVPPLINDDTSVVNKDALAVANGLVYREGNWWVTTGLLQHFMAKVSAAKLREHAINSALPTRTFKENHFITVPSSDAHTAGSIEPKGNAYSLEETLKLIDTTTATSPDRNKELQQIFNDGYQLRLEQGEVNPVRGQIREYKEEIESLKEANKTIEQSLFGLKKKSKELNEQIRHFNACESTYLKMVSSQLFSEEELAAPANTQVELNAAEATQQKELDTLQQRHVELTETRGLYNQCITMFGDCKLDEKLSNLKINQKRTAEDESHKSTALDDHKKALTDLNDDKTNASNQYQEKSLLLAELTQLKASYDPLSQHFTDEQLPTLASSLAEAKDSTEKRHEKLIIEQQRTEQELQSHRELKSKHELFVKRFPEHNSALGLRTRLESDHRNLNSSLATNQKDQRLKSEALQELNILKPSFTLVAETYQKLDLPIDKIEVSLTEEKSTLIHALQKIDEQIPQLTPFVASLEQFEQNYNVSIELAIQQHQEKRAELERQFQQLSTSLSDLKQQLRGYQKVGVAPMQLSKQVLATIPQAQSTVVTFIQSLAITDERKKFLLTTFSQLLHAPIAQDLDEATKWVKQLNESELDYPVFEKGSFKVFCEDEKNTKTIGITGFESLQVKTALDPSLLPELIANLEKKISALTQNKQTLENALEEYDLEGQKYQLLKQAKQALDIDARKQVRELQETQITTAKKLEEVCNFIEHKAFTMLPKAIQFNTNGGTKRIQTLEQQLATLEPLIEQQVSQLTQLEEQLTDDNLDILNLAEQYEKLEGDKRLDILETNLAQLKEDLERAKSNKTSAETKYQQFFHLVSPALQFIQKGGLEYYEQLSSSTESLARQIQTLEENISQQSAAQQQLENELETARGLAVKAKELVDKWANSLNGALLYLAQNGPEFDLQYESKLTKHKKDLEVIHMKLRFNFEEAQIYVTQKSQNVEREELLANLQSAELQIEQQESLQKQNQEDIEQNNELIQSLVEKAAEFDHAMIKMMSKYRDACKLLSFIRDEFDLSQLTPPSTAHLQYATGIESEYRALKADEPIEIQDTFLTLTDAIGRLEFSEQQTILDTKNQSLARTLTGIKQQIAGHANKDNGLTPNEQQELLTTDTRQCFENLFKYLNHFRELVAVANNKREKVEKDIEAQQQNLSHSMGLMTSQLQDNFELLKRSLTPGSTQAGFYIEADIIDKAHIEGKIESLINTIRVKESSRLKEKSSADKEGITIKSQKKYDDELKAQIRENFYRAVFKGKQGEIAPKMYFTHPSLATGKRKLLTDEFSTGQKTALSLLLLTKLAQYSSARSSKVGFGLMTRNVKRKSVNNKVVIIDGLFSNLSDPKLIRFSLDTVKLMQDQFQLIGWVHSPEYKNDPEIFPTFYSIQRTDYGGHSFAQDRSQTSSLMMPGAFFADRTEAGRANE